MAQDDDSDDALIALAGRGDRRAASVLIARHSPRILKLCLHMLGNRAAAEDAVQDTFLRLWERADRWRPGRARLETWLYRVASNACLDRHRRARRLAPAIDVDERADDAPSATEQMAGEDRRRLVDDAMRALPERQRIAMTLCHFQELSNAEIAETMEISIDAVESLLARGRRAMRAALESVRAELMEAAE